MENVAISSIVWIAWERQRRSILLSQRLCASLEIIDESGYGLLRFPLSVIKTLVILARYRKKVVVVQNPSMILATLACFFKKVFGYKLIVDRHSNFMLDEQNQRRMKYKIFMALSRFTSRTADLTIVTNRSIARRIELSGGAPFILTDPFIQQSRQESVDIQPNTFSLFFPSTWARDEPVREAAEACRLLGPDYQVYITGKPKQSVLDEMDSRPDNLICTGFIPDDRYFELMNKCQAVMPLTRFPEVLVCGGYEAMSLGKPLLLGDSAALREYYPQGAIFTDCTAGDIAQKIVLIRSKYVVLKKEIIALHKNRLEEWNERFQFLNVKLQTL